MSPLICCFGIDVRMYVCMYVIDSLTSVCGQDGHWYVMGTTVQQKNYVPSLVIMYNLHHIVNAHYCTTMSMNVA